MNSGADLIYQLTQALYIEGSLFFVLFIRQVTVVTRCLQNVFLIKFDSWVEDLSTIQTIITRTRTPTPATD